MFQSQKREHYYAHIGTKAKPAETTIENYQSSHGYTKTTGSGTLADDTSVFAIGTQSVKITTQADTNTVIIAKTGLSAIDLSGKYLKIVCRVDTPSIAASNISIDIGDDAFENYYRFFASKAVSYLRADRWYELTLSFGDATVTGEPNRASLTAIRVRCTGNGTIYNFWLNRISAVAEPTEGICSVTFDDGFLSVYTKARQRMSLYGMRGTAYIQPKNIGKANYMTVAQAKELQDVLLWHVAGQTDNRLDTQANAQAVEAELIHLKKWLVENGFNGADHEALQNGGFDETKVMPLIYKYFATCRTIAEQAETLPPADWRRIRMLNITETDTLQSVQDKIDQAVTHKEYLCMLFHDIVDTVTDSSTQTSTDKFNDIIDYLATSGLRVLPVDEVYSLY
jgi:hypothetical protein